MQRRTLASASPADADTVRAEIEEIRAPMSGSMDEVEESIRRRKERMEERLDVYKRVRDRPFSTLGAIFGAGLVLGLLTTGHRVKDVSANGGMDRVSTERAELWERRARRLARVARQQREELDRLREGSDLWEEESPLFPEVRHEEEDAEDGYSRYTIRDDHQRLFYRDDTRT